MITERIACTKRARLAGAAVACAAPMASSSGWLWPGSGGSGFEGAISDGEQVLRESGGLYGDDLMVEEGAWVNELHESDGAVITVVG
jgi:hypothetical protein